MFLYCGSFGNHGPSAFEIVKSAWEKLASSLSPQIFHYCVYFTAFTLASKIEYLL